MSADTHTLTAPETVVTAVTRRETITRDNTRDSATLQTLVDVQLTAPVDQPGGANR